MVEKYIDLQFFYFLLEEENKMDRTKVEILDDEEIDKYLENVIKKKKKKDRMFKM